MTSKEIETGKERETEKSQEPNPKRITESGVRLVHATGSGVGYFAALPQLLFDAAAARTFRVCLAGAWMYC